MQELLLRSSRPLAALEMRRDLKHWQQALSLAQQLAPGSIAALSKEHAAMLEMVGEHAEARSHYQQVGWLSCCSCCCAVATALHGYMNAADSHCCLGAKTAADLAMLYSLRAKVVA